MQWIPMLLAHTFLFHWKKKKKDEPWNINLVGGGGKEQYFLDINVHIFSLESNH